MRQASGKQAPTMISNMISKFIWTDLSTFDIQSAKRFYSQCFGWEYQELDDGYRSCLVQGRPTAGLYTMPEKFQRIGMPSFWMSYIHVDGLEKIVRLAEQHDIQRGSTHFIEYVERRSNPVVYWLIIGTWLVLSAYLTAEAVIGT